MTFVQNYGQGIKINVTIVTLLHSKKSSHLA